MKRMNLLFWIGTLFLIPFLNSCFPIPNGDDGYPSVRGVVNPVAVAGNGQVTISWSYPAESENIFVVEYDPRGVDSLGKYPYGGDVCYAGIGGLCKGVITTDTVAVIMGLTNGKTYKINVVVGPPQGVDSTDAFDFDHSWVLVTPTVN
jgi:hypothetical protein